MAKSVTHLSITRSGPFGGTITRSLCNRSRTLSDGMNLADRAGVTCKFCLRVLALQDKQARMAA